MGDSLLVSPNDVVALDAVPAAAADVTGAGDAGAAAVLAGAQSLGCEEIRTCVGTRRAFDVGVVGGNPDIRLPRSGPARWEWPGRGSLWRSRLVGRRDELGVQPFFIFGWLPGVDADQLGVDLVHGQGVDGGRESSSVGGQAEVVDEPAGEGGNACLAAVLRGLNLGPDGGISACGVLVDLDDVPCELPAAADGMCEPGQALVDTGCVHRFAPRFVGFGEVDDHPAEFGEDGGLAAEDGVDGLDCHAGFRGDRLECGGGVAVAEEQVSGGGEDAVPGDGRLLLSEGGAARGSRIGRLDSHIDRVALYLNKV